MVSTKIALSAEKVLLAVASAPDYGAAQSKYRTA